jgi:hypothetical protein
MDVFKRSKCHGKAMIAGSGARRPASGLLDAPPAM